VKHPRRFCGVRYHYGAYQCRIRREGRLYDIGSWPTAEQAAWAHDACVRIMDTEGMGRCTLNFPATEPVPLDIRAAVIRTLCVAGLIVVK